MCPFPSLKKIIVRIGLGLNDGFIVANLAPSTVTTQIVDFSNVHNFDKKFV
jgi:hypothetical protein